MIKKIIVVFVVFLVLIVPCSAFVVPIDGDYISFDDYYVPSFQIGVGYNRSRFAFTTFSYGKNNVTQQSFLKSYPYTGGIVEFYGNQTTVFSTMISEIGVEGATTGDLLLDTYVQLAGKDFIIDTSKSYRVRLATSSRSENARLQCRLIVLDEFGIRHDFPLTYLTELLTIEDGGIYFSLEEIVRSFLGNFDALYRVIEMVVNVDGDVRYFNASLNVPLISSAQVAGFINDFTSNVNHAGYNNGYSVGYLDGYENGADLEVRTIFDGIIDGFSSIFNVNLFGSVSLGDLLYIALAVIVVIVALRFFAGG